MRLLLLLLLIGTVNFVVCSEDYFEFSLEELLPDLQAIEQYIAKNPAGTIEAVIRWSRKLSFIIHKDKDFLHVLGRFFVMYENVFLYNLYYDKVYFKKGAFYMEIDQEPFRKFPRKPVSKNKVVFFREDSARDPSNSQIRIPNPDILLSISYFSSEEIESMIRPFTRAKKAIMHSVATDESPSTFLATTQSPYPYFVEYSWLKRNRKSGFSVGKQRKLRLLLGERGPYIPQGFLSGGIMGDSSSETPDLSKRVTITSKEVYELDFYERPGTVSPTGIINSPKELLSIRMASTGFLAVQDSSGVKMLSSSDLTRSCIPTEHTISARELVAKLRIVEPRFSYETLSHGTRDIPPSNRPDNIDFQLMGHLLVKSMNLQAGGNLNPDCPLVITYNGSGMIRYPGGTAKKICTNDSKLWVEGASGHIDGEITLTYN